MKKKIVVIGASNIDIMAISDNKLISKDSNIGSVSKSFGGVGRNIAENLGRLNLSPTFITLLGKDLDGKALKKHLTNAGVTVYYETCQTTPMYVAIIDETGDMHVAVNAMKSLDTFKIDTHEHLLDDADLIVLDLNVSDTVIQFVVKKQKPLYIDAISSTKALKIKPYLSAVHTLKLNTIEAAALTGESCNTTASQEKAVKGLLNLGVTHVYMTKGAEGILHGTKRHLKHYKALPVDVISTTGAGDSFLAGIIFGDVHQIDAALAGLYVAQETLLTKETVHPMLKENTLQKKVKEHTNNDRN